MKTTRNKKLFLKENKNILNFELLEDIINIISKYKLRPELYFKENMLSLYYSEDYFDKLNLSVNFNNFHKEIKTKVNNNKIGISDGHYFLFLD